MSLPLLRSATVEANEAGGSVAVPPPRGFRKVVELRDAWRSGRGSDIDGREAPKSASQKSGLRYERKVLSALTSHFGGLLDARPWIGYRDASGYGTCQPDALLDLEPEGIRALVIFEVKLQHTPDAWWQLRHLYAPVVGRLRPDLPLRLCEVTASYDPSVPFPEKPDVLFSLAELERWAAWGGDSLGVFQLKL